jgi:hypothetical protein
MSFAAEAEEVVEGAEEDLAVADSGGGVAGLGKLLFGGARGFRARHDHGHLAVISHEIDQAFGQDWEVAMPDGGYGVIGVGATFVCCSRSRRVTRASRRSVLAVRSAIVRLSWAISASFS